MIAFTLDVYCYATHPLSLDYIYRAPYKDSINAQGDQEGNPKVGTVALSLELDNHNFVSGGVVVVVEERAQ